MFKEQRGLVRIEACVRSVLGLDYWGNVQIVVAAGDDLQLNDGSQVVQSRWSPVQRGTCVTIPDVSCDKSKTVRGVKGRG
jgi:hypothetical protein